MYGDTAVLRSRASDLRALAGDTRERATTLRSAVGNAWVSSAAASFTHALGERATDLDSAATALDEAAEALEAHARAVDAVKQAIVEAEHWISDRWNDAVNLVGNAVEALEDGVGKVFSFFGKKVPDFLVHEAHDIVHTVPSLPVPGSQEWLALSDTFHRRGW